MFFSNPILETVIIKMLIQNFKFYSISRIRVDYTYYNKNTYNTNKYGINHIIQQILNKINYPTFEK